MNPFPPLPPRLKNKTYLASDKEKCQIWDSPKPKCGGWIAKGRGGLGLRGGPVPRGRPLEFPPLPMAPAARWGL